MHGQRVLEGSIDARMHPDNFIEDRDLTSITYFTFCAPTVGGEVVRVDGPIYGHILGQKRAEGLPLHRRVQNGISRFEAQPVGLT